MIGMIPRLFHQIYLAGDLPPRLARNAAEHRARNPGWEYQLWDAGHADAFVAANFAGEIAHAFGRINKAYGAAKADLLRQLLIWHFGGVYLDIKSELTLPLDDVLREDDAYILTQWRNGPGEQFEGIGLHPELAHIPGGEFQIYHVIAEAGHPFTQAVINRIVQNIERYRPWTAVGRNGVVRTTGPIAYTQAIHPLLGEARHRLTTEEEIGARMSISDYDHLGTFKRHYSTLQEPVVTLPAFQRLMSRGFCAARELKKMVRRDPR